MLLFLPWSRCFLALQPFVDPSSWLLMNFNLSISVRMQEEPADAPGGEWGVRSGMWGLQLRQRRV